MNCYTYRLSPLSVLSLPRNSSSSFVLSSVFFHEYLLRDSSSLFNYSHFEVCKGLASLN